MSNQNDPTASVYDFAYAPIKGDDVVAEEVELIRSLAGAAPASILDIGCGTGRHAIGLFDLGYDVLAVDSSAAMLAELYAKRPLLETQCADVLHTEIQGKFDLIILMWNALAEIAKTETELARLLSVFGKHLQPEGKVLINFDDPAQFDPARMDFKLSSLHQDKTYDVDWAVVSFDPEQNISKSSETIIVTSSNGKEIFSTEIIQKWWKLSEIESQAARSGFDSEVRKIKSNNEIYLVLQHAFHVAN